MIGAIRAWLRRRRMFRSALAFNKRWTFSSHPKLGGVWRCPSCGADHHYTSYNVFSGRQFKSCCEFEAGHRLDRDHATGF